MRKKNWLSSLSLRLEYLPNYWSFEIVFVTSAGILLVVDNFVDKQWGKRFDIV